MMPQTRYGGLVVDWTPVEFERLRAARKSRDERRLRMQQIMSLMAEGWSQGEIAEVIGVSRQRVSQLIQSYRRRYELSELWGPERGDRDTEVP